MVKLMLFDYSTGKIAKIINLNSDLSNTQAHDFIRHDIATRYPDHVDSVWVQRKIKNRTLIDIGKSYMKYIIEEITGYKNEL